MYRYSHLLVDAVLAIIQVERIAKKVRLFQVTALAVEHYL